MSVYRTFGEYIGVKYIVHDIFPMEYGMEEGTYTTYRITIDKSQLWLLSKIPNIVLECAYKNVINNTLMKDTIMKCAIDDNSSDSESLKFTMNIVDCLVLTLECFVMTVGDLNSVSEHFIRWCKNVNMNPSEYVKAEGTEVANVCLEQNGNKYPGRIIFTIVRDTMYYLLCVQVDGIYRLNTSNYYWGCKIHKKGDNIYIVMEVVKHSVYNAKEELKNFLRYIWGI